MIFVVLTEKYMAKQPTPKKKSTRTAVPIVNTGKKGEIPWKMKTPVQNKRDTTTFNYTKGDSTMQVKTSKGKIVSKTKGKK